MPTDLPNRFAAYRTVTTPHSAPVPARPWGLRNVRPSPFGEVPPTDPHIQEVFTALAADEARTETIANDALALAA
jgi:hypothetical protein